ncbi:MAG TPA: alpha/beta hydrolase [Caulobacteraceae bacterium]
MKSLLAFVAAFTLLDATGSAATAASTVGDCHIGAYRMGDGSVTVVGPSTGDTMRWRRVDGTTGALHRSANGDWTSTLGWTERPDGKIVRFSDCAQADLDFNGQAGHRIAFDTKDTTFKSGPLTLAGRLVLPKGGGRVPIVVLVHGSENYSGRDIYPQQWMLPAEGVGVFVYDKRGTGHSEGKYTQDFDTLANDAVAAMGEARRLAGSRASRVGFAGGSQGGWVAPLAASRTRADFVVVGFGLLINALEEDREEIALEMKLKGDSDEDIKHALELSDAAAVIVTSHLQNGYEAFDALRTKYRDAPWYKHVHGNYLGDLLPLSREEMQAKAAELDVNTTWRDDGMATQRKLHIPELWEIGADDLAAPSAVTERRLKAFIAQGKPITIARFPHAEHGIYNFEVKPDGTRVDTRNAEGYYQAWIDFVRDGALHGRYGEATVTRPKVFAKY